MSKDKKSDFNISLDSENEIDKQDQNILPFKRYE
jgi:hypothetical protein